jgi:hypothetical protein
MFSTRTHRRLARRIALGLAVAAIAAPSALAVDTGDLGNTQWGPANIVAPAVTIPPELSHREFGPANFRTTPTPVVTRVIEPTGFDFLDAAVGAAIAIAAMLLAAAAFLFTRRRGHLAGA